MLLSDFDTAQWDFEIEQNSMQMQGTEGPYTPGIWCLSSSIGPIALQRNHNIQISRCKNAMDMWVIWLKIEQNSMQNAIEL